MGIAASISPTTPVNRLATASTVDVGVQPAVTLTSTWDALGRRTALADSLGGATSYGYDVNGWMTRLTSTGGEIFDFAYDLSGRFRQVAFPNGLSMDYDYDGSGKLQSLEYRQGGGALSSFTYLYDALGNLLAITEGARVREYSYDALERLVSGGTAGLPESYSYDAAGNRASSHLSSLYAYDNANQLEEDDTFLYTYDAVGNRTAREEKATGARTTYRYNGFNQLVGVDFPDGTSASYRYDGLGRRIEKNVDGTLRRWIYDGVDLRLEYDGSNALIARYTHGPDVDQPLSMERGGERYYYLTDHQGSVRFLTDSTGAQVNAYEYDSFGGVLSETLGVENPYRYTGREFDGETGLYYYRARYYDPATGRFLSRDPEGLAGGTPNLYSYLGNNPVNGTDPTGLFTPWDVLDVVSFGLSLKDFIDCPSLENGLWLALDTVSLLPLVPSLGTVKRGADLLDAAGDISRAANRADDAFDAARAANRAEDGIDAARRSGDLGDGATRLASDCFCFAADTEVETTLGETEIIDLHVGDEVLASDPETGETSWREVVGVFERDVRELLVLDLGGETVETTAPHPFWVVDRGCGSKPATLRWGTA